MQLIKAVEIFKPGRLISGNGSEDIYSLADLQEIVNSYEPAVHEAPVVIGHDNDKNWARLTTSKTQLANGWVKKVYLDGNTLLADVEFDDYVVNCLKDGTLKKRSIGLYPRNSKHNPTPGKLSLRHLAMLGIEPPAVKGLRDIKIYSEMDNTNLLNEKAAEWLAFALIDEGNGFNNEITEIIPTPTEENNWLYDADAAKFIGQFRDTEDRIFDFELTKNDDQWASAIKMADIELEEDEEVEANEAEQVAEPIQVVANEMSDAEKMAAQIKMLEEKLARYEEQAELEMQERAKVYCEDMYSSGYLTEAQIKKDALMQIIYALEKMAGTLTYSENNKEISVVNGIKALLKSFPKQITFSEAIVARAEKTSYKSPYKNASQESNKQYSEIRAYMEKHGLTNFAEGYQAYKSHKKLSK